MRSASGSLQCGCLFTVPIRRLTSGAIARSISHRTNSLLHVSCPTNPGRPVTVWRRWGGWMRRLRAVHHLQYKVSGASGPARYREEFVGHSDQRLRSGFLNLSILSAASVGVSSLRCTVSWISLKASFTASWSHLTSVVSSSPEDAALYPCNTE